VAGGRPFMATLRPLGTLCAKTVAKQAADKLEHSVCRHSPLASRKSQVAPLVAASLLSFN